MHHPLCQALAMPQPVSQLQFSPFSSPPDPRVYDLEGGCCYFQLSSPRITFFFNWGAALSQGKQRLSGKHTPSEAGLDAANRELPWGQQPSLRRSGHSKFLPPGRPPTCFLRAGQQPGVVSGHQERWLLSAPGHSPGVFCTPETLFLWAQQKASLADCYWPGSSAFREFGDEESHFQQPLELTLAPGTKSHSSCWSCDWSKGSYWQTTCVLAFKGMSC